MKQNSVIRTLIIVLVAGWFGVAPVEALTLKAKPGSTVRIEGTSTVHDWTVEGRLIGGSVEVNGDFPVEPGQILEPGEMEVLVDAFIPISSLKSVKDGKPYSTKMDEIMYEKLGKPTHSKIQYQLDKLTLKSLPEAEGNPYLFDATGRLIVAGVTNTIELPVEVTPTAEGQVRFATRTSVKMTDYKIDPPAPKIALGMIKTGDEVQITIEWITANVPAK